jgi:hypothetical protein
MKTKTAIEKIAMVLEKSPYVKGDNVNIEGEFVIFGDNSVQFTLGHGTYLFDKEGDLLLKIVHRES